MAHEIEGNRAFFTKNRPWHNRGIVLPNAPTFDEAINILVQGDTYLKLDLQAVAGGETMPLKKSCVIVRTDGENGFKEFKTVGSDFELTQPIEAFEPHRKVCESGLIDLEAGGLLYDGAQAWLLGKIKNSETAIIGNDTVKAHFLMYTGFDGSRGIGALDVNERVVCSNTLGMALREGNRNINMKAKHTKNVRTKIDDIAITIEARLSAFNKQIEAYKYLATKKMQRQGQEAYIQNVFLTPDEISEKTEVSGKKQAIVQNVIDLLDTQKGLELVPAIRGTAWQAYNAISDYVTHDYGRSEDSRFVGQFFGESAKINQKAFELALTM